MTIEEIMRYLRNTVELIGVDLEPDGDWTPNAFLFTENAAKILPLAPMMELDRGKDLAVILLEGAIRHFRAEALALVLSAWMVEGKSAPEGEESIDMLVRPSEHPNRKEVLMLTVMKADEQRILSAEIKRVPGGPPELLWRDKGPWDSDDAVRSGRFWDGPLRALKEVAEK